MLTLLRGWVQARLLFRWNFSPCETYLHQHTLCPISRTLSARGGYRSPAAAACSFQTAGRRKGSRESFQNIHIAWHFHITGLKPSDKATPDCKGGGENMVLWFRKTEAEGTSGCWKAASTLGHAVRGSTRAASAYSQNENTKFPGALTACIQNLREKCRTETLLNLRGQKK